MQPIVNLDERRPAAEEPKGGSGGLELAILRGFLYFTFGMTFIVFTTRAVYGPGDQPPGDSLWLIASVAAAGLACSVRRPTG